MTDADCDVQRQRSVDIGYAAGSHSTNSHGNVCTVSLGLERFAVVALG
jgi:hypothetical protein